MSDTTAAPAPSTSGPAARSDQSAGSGVPRLVVVLATLALAWLAISGVQALKDIVAPLLLTLNLFIVAYPVQTRLTRIGLPRWIGAIVSGLIVFAILIVFFGSLTWALTEMITQIPQYQSSFSRLYGQLVQLLHGFGINEGQVLQQAQQQFNPSSITGVLTGALSGVGGMLSLIAVVVTIIFMAMIDSISFPQRLQVAARTQPRVVDALTQFSGGVRRYWIVSSIFGLIVAALDVGVLLYLGVPLALVWGLLAFLTNYIPNIGFLLGIVPPALMALLANDPRTALIVIVAYCVINFIVQSVIQPKFNGDAVGVTATLSLLSLLFWAWVLGPLGALLALPATLLCKNLLIDIDPRTQWLNAFLASDPETGDPQIDPATGDRWDEKDGADGAAENGTDGATAFVPGGPSDGKAHDPAEEADRGGEHSGDRDGDHAGDRGDRADRRGDARPTSDGARSIGGERRGDRA
ncbi:AI-2E family transporter [Agilicoccus flavus]|uniref:AI-2E family transporter n=1 Tax=Agilicoccus flavus TaxID=2775968 RepID=UPI001CF6269E|nr:AI-2E family transporter [Agilicoccus flavus]